MESMSLFALLLVVLVVVFYVRKKTSYTLAVRVQPEEAATISDILHKKRRGFVVAEFTVRVKEGYMLTKWTGTLPRLEGYDPARWYNTETGKVRLEIDRNETMTLHFEAQTD
ncbi:MAG: hypothetical protein M0R49_04475 [Limnochordia bacterium]|nr:hypothetical protein [Limnochordia bacterium]